MIQFDADFAASDLADLKSQLAGVYGQYGDSVELILINGPEVQSPWVGETEKVIRHIFEYASVYHRRHGHQLIIFIDEADSLLMSRDGSPSWNVSNVSTFLSKMDGLEDNGAFVMLASNRPDAIDEALLRDGRCDRKIRVSRPTVENAAEIFERAAVRAATHSVRGLLGTSVSRTVRCLRTSGMLGEEPSRVSVARM